LQDGLLKFKYCSNHCNVEATSDTGTGGFMGSVFGVDSYNHLQIEDCAAYGDVKGLNRVGGFAGRADGLFINNCKAEGNVTLIGEGEAGGFAGYNRSNTVINDCYAVGNVQADDEEGSHVAGFVGNNRNEINRCYSIGEAKIGETDAYGFVSNPSTENECYWDTEVSGITEDGGNAEGKTTAKMQSIATFSEWDIAEYESYEDETWFIVDGEDYPRLSYEAPEDPDPPEDPEDPEDPEEKDKPLFYGMGNNSFIDALRKNLERIEKELNIEF